MMLLETDAILEPEAENPPETVIALAPTATISPFPAFSQRRSPGHPTDIRSWGPPRHTPRPQGKGGEGWEGCSV